MSRTRSEVGTEPDATRRGLPSARGRWSAPHARRVLEAWRSSGLTLTAYARRLGMGRERLAWWCRRLKMEAPRRTSRTRRFVPLVVKRAETEADHPAGLSVEVVLRSGRLVRVTVERDFGALGRLIEALETIRC